MINVGKPITIEDGGTTPTKWWCKDLGLTEDDRSALMNEEWLSDKHLSAAAKLLKTQFPETRGFQSTVTGEFTPATCTSSPYYQFHFFSNHWCVSWMRDGTVTLCNSLFNAKTGLPEPLCVQLKQIYGQQVKSVQVLTVQQQKGSVDCGCFAIAFAVSARFLHALSQHDEKNS